MNTQAVDPEAGRGDDVSDEPVPVHVAWSRVMADVHNVSKDSRNTQQNFNFRGIDAVMNAVGPAMRAHGVFVIPEVLRHETRELVSAKGRPMTGHTVTVNFHIYGPAGDTMHGIEIGESYDFGDKGSTQARSVALRTFLLQSLMIPTDAPDPDQTVYERGYAEWWGGWKTQEDHDRDREILLDESKALTQQWRDVIRGELLDHGIIDNSGRWAERITVNQAGEWDELLRRVDKMQKEEPFETDLPSDNTNNN